MSGRKHRDIFASEIEWKRGSDDKIQFTAFNMNDDDPASPMIVLSRFEPGTRVEPHTHAANYMEYILSGQQTVGKTTFGPGDLRIVKGGTGYGPIVVGPEGCEVLIVFQEGRGAIMETLPRKKTA